MFTIYLRRNKVNDKCYVGQTSDFRKRENDWNCLKTYYANKHLTADRAEFGLENFTVDVLAECETREEAWELEQYYIKELCTLYPNGYNLSIGGAGPSGVQVSDETKQKLSEALKGRRLTEEHKQKLSESKKGENNPLYGKHLSDEAKLKISENNAKFWLGKHLSDEAKLKISEAKKGIIPKCVTPKPVYQYTKDKVLVKVWPSTMECGRAGYNQGNVSACCNGKRKTHKNHIWSYTPL